MYESSPKEMSAVKAPAVTVRENCESRSSLRNSSVITPRKKESHYATVKQHVMSFNEKEKLHRIRFLCSPLRRLPV